jgi:uncharacterized delta-60 repeat protein
VEDLHTRHSWEFRAYKDSDGDPRGKYPWFVGGHRVNGSGLLNGAFHAQHNFGHTINNLPALGEVEANASGSTYLMYVDGVLGDVSDDDDIGTGAFYFQRRAFLKNSSTATLSLTISELYLMLADGNPYSPSGEECGMWDFSMHTDPQILRGHCWMALWAQAGMTVSAFDLSGNFRWKGEGQVVLRGWIDNFEHITYPYSFSKQLLGYGDVDFEEINLDPTTSAEVSLSRPKRVQIPLDNVPVGGRFMVVTRAHVMTYNRRQGESEAIAYFRDPQSTGGRIELTYEGLEPIEPFTDEEPDFPPPPPPVCSTGTTPQAGSVQFGAPEAHIGEGSFAARVFVTRTGGSQGDLLLRLRTSGGTANAADFEVQDTPVYFADGDAHEQSIFIPVNDNSAEDGSRTVNLTLSDLHGCGVIGTPDSIVMTIHDDDAPPPPPPPEYTVGGEVTGLLGAGLVLREFEGVDEIITANGPYAFDVPRLPGTRYDIRVSRQPSNPVQQCSVVNATGTIGDSNVTNVNVHCVNTPDSFGVDPTFGAAGRVVDANPGSAVALQADGRIVVASRLYGAARLTRYLPDGALDTAFGAGGYVDVPLGGGTHDALNKLIIQSDGRILAAGFRYNDASSSEDFVVMRFNADGSPDASFGTQGSVLTDFGVGGQDRARDMLLQPDGKIVLAGTEAHATGGVYSEVNFGAARYNADGTLDAGFGMAGLAVIRLANYAINGHAAVLQPDGAIVIAGQARANGGSFQDTAVARLLPDGSMDTAYGVAGIRRVNLSSGYDDFATDALLMPDGKLILSLFQGPNGSRDFTLARFTSAGELDTSFNGTGQRSTSLGASNDIARHLALDAGGKIIAAGDSADTIYQNGGDFAIARFNADGSIDGTFGYNGAIKVDFYGADDSVDGGIVVQPDGNIVAVGVAVSGTSPQFGMVRVLPAGRTDGPS